MKVVNSDKFIKIVADEGKKITNANRDFFSDYVYLSKNDSADNYEEVGREIWKHFIEDKPTDFDILQEKINDNNSMITNLEEISLDTDFKLLLLDMRVKDLEGPLMASLSKSSFTMVNYNVTKVPQVSELLKKRIIRNTYNTKEEMREMLEIYNLAGRITAEQYNELTELLDK